MWSRHVWYIWYETDHFHKNMLCLCHLYYDVFKQNVGFCCEIKGPKFGDLTSRQPIGESRLLVCVYVLCTCTASDVQNCCLCSRSTLLPWRRYRENARGLLIPTFPISRTASGDWLSFEGGKSCNEQTAHQRFMRTKNFLAIANIDCQHSPFTQKHLKGALLVKLCLQLHNNCAMNKLLSRHFWGWWKTS